MNKTATESASLRAFAARSETSSICEFGRLRTSKRIERIFAGRQTRATAIPGIEVAYIEVDAEDWKQLVAA